MRNAESGLRWRKRKRGWRVEGGGWRSKAIDLAAMTDAEEMNRVLINIHSVNDPIVADAEPTAVRAF